MKENEIKPQLFYMSIHDLVLSFDLSFFLNLAKVLPTSVFPVTSSNVQIRLQNFLTFSFNPFAALV